MFTTVYSKKSLHLPPPTIAYCIIELNRANAGRSRLIFRSQSRNLKVAPALDPVPPKKGKNLFKKYFFQYLTSKG